jgi:hypothetical protein
MHRHRNIRLLGEQPSLNGEFPAAYFLFERTTNLHDYLFL